MKRPQLIVLVMFFSTRYAFGAVFVPPAPVTVSDDAMLSAIAEVETGNNSTKRGHHGERTQLQILPATWREFSRMPHSASATHPEETERVARAYLAVIRRTLRARGLPETPFFIAAGWNAGAGWKHLTRSTVSYAERVANLVEETEPSPAEEPRINLPVPARSSTELAISEIFKHPSSRNGFLAARDDSIPVIDLEGSN